MKTKNKDTAAVSLNLSGKRYKVIKWLLCFPFIIGCGFLTLLFFPQVLFQEKYSSGNITVYSDRKIDSNIKNVLDTAILKITQSELYDSNLNFTVFLCNDIWRFSFYSFGNSDAGAITHTRLTGNIFIRPCNISANTIIPPKNWLFAKPPYSLADRPLSYFIAHEMVHDLQLHCQGSSYFTTHKWITEGYADFIAKGESFDFAANLKLLKQGAPELAPNAGLYRYFHLLIFYLINKKHLTIKSIVKYNPSSLEVEKEVLGSSVN